MLCLYVKSRLAVVLAERRMRMTDLVELTGISFNTIRRYYYGDDIKKLDLDIVNRICQALNCTISDLFIFVNPDEQEMNK